MNHSPEAIKPSLFGGRKQPSPEMHEHVVEQNEIIEKTTLSTHQQTDTPPVKTIPISIILGIIGIIFSGIIGLVFGIIAVKKAAKEENKTGRILGTVAIVLSIIMIIVKALFFVLLGTSIMPFSFLM